MRDYLKASLKISQMKKDDPVRVQHKLGPFDKSYYLLWTDRVFHVEKLIKGNKRPLVYLQQPENEVKRRYYPEEIQKIKLKEFRVEKII